MACEDSPSLPVANCEMMSYWLYEFDAYDLAGVLLPHHLPPQPNTLLVSSDAGGCYRAPHYYT